MYVCIYICVCICTRHATLYILCTSCAKLIAPLWLVDQQRYPAQNTNLTQSINKTRTNE